MTLDTILLARAMRNVIDAKYVANALDVARRPRDRADAAAIRFWSNILPIVDDREAMLGAGHAGVLSHAAALPDYVVETSGTIGELVRAWNAGAGTSWRHPAFGPRREAATPVLRAERAA